MKLKGLLISLWLLGMNGMVAAQNGVAASIPSLSAQPTIATEADSPSITLNYQKQRADRDQERQRNARQRERERQQREDQIQNDRQDSNWGDRHENGGFFPLNEDRNNNDQWRSNQDRQEQEERDRDRQRREEWSQQREQQWDRFHER